MRQPLLGGIGETFDVSSMSHGVDAVMKFNIPQGCDTAFSFYEIHKVATDATARLRSVD